MNTTNNPIIQYYQSIKKCRVQKYLFVYSILICLLGYLFIGLLPQDARALTMSNDNYQIKGNPNSLSEIKPEVEKKQQAEEEKLQQDKYGGKNYIVQAGYEAKNKLPSFSVSTSKNLIDYGILSATNPVIRTNILTINSPSSGYHLFSSEDHPLTSNHSVIPNTTCDNGSCTAAIAAEWTNTLTYGLGYHCDNQEGKMCSEDFSHNDYYKQFADLNKKDFADLILHAELPQKKNAAQITYKVNISGTQAEGSYTNTITYLAVPGY